jgi:hypothetical protein
MTVTCIISLCFISFVEWLIHRFVMHRPFLNFRYAFTAHALVHHSRFKCDKSYHLIHKEDAEKIPMAWWNGPVLIALGSILPTLVIFFISVPGKWYLLIEFVVLCSLYYWAYERLHWCMHLPKGRKLELLPPFHWLNGHHLLHHRNPKTNYNVVLPIADLCLGTLSLRSKTSFDQPRGPSVPDVQPRTHKKFAH